MISADHPFELICSPFLGVLPLLYLAPPVASGFSFSYFELNIFMLYDFGDLD